MFHNHLKNVKTSVSNVPSDLFGHATFQSLEQHVHDITRPSACARILFIRTYWGLGHGTIDSRVLLQLYIIKIIL